MQMAEKCVAASSEFGVGLFMADVAQSDDVMRSFRDGTISVLVLLP
jgi:hypothetical protein